MELKNGSHGIPLPDKIIPMNDNNFMLVDMSRVDYDGNGTTSAKEVLDDVGTHLVRNSIAERDTIETRYRKLGLEVYVIEDKTTYRLENGITNENWKEVTYNKGVSLYGGSTLPEDTFGNEGDFFLFYTKTMELDRDKIMNMLSALME